MVFYISKRQHRQAADGKITDLPDELLLRILDHLEPLDVLQFRLTSPKLTPAGNTAISQRTKRLYISPSRSSLLNAVKICGHSTFSSHIEELTVLGSIPQREEWLWSRRPVRKEYGEWFMTWSTTFPTVKNTIDSEEANTADRSFDDVYKPLLDALATLPQLKKLSFANRVSRSRPGFNQIKQASLDSFPKRHLGKPSAKYKRWSDGYAMFAILAALGPRIQEFVFPHLFADVYKDLANAEDRFSLKLCQDAMTPEVEGDNITKDHLLRARLGGYIVRNGCSLVSRGAFTTSGGTFIAEMRRSRPGHFWLDGVPSTSQASSPSAPRVDAGLLAIAQSRSGWHNDKIINTAKVQLPPKRIIHTKTRPSIPEHLHGTIT